jgi:hypothetical protein
LAHRVVTKRCRKQRKMTRGRCVDGSDFPNVTLEKTR